MSRRPPSLTVPQQRSLLYHLETLYLFTKSDLKAIVYPQTAFGLLSALAGAPLTTGAASPAAIFARVPLALLWTWLHLLLFTVSNQRLHSSVLEDAINKPHRPIPAGRISANAARRLLLGLAPVAFLFSAAVGAALESLALAALSWANNDLAAGDDHWLARNAMNALGITAFGAGATAALLGADGVRTDAFYAWCALLAAVILTSVQAQDLRDQEGDRARGRGTLPIVWGDAAARWSVAGPVALWSVVCPAFWGAGPLSYAVAGASGGWLAFRTLWWRDVQADRGSWKMWCVWMSLLYFLPLLARVWRELFFERH